MRKQVNLLKRNVMFLSSLILIIAIIFTLIFFKVKPLIITNAQNQAKMMFLNAANEAVVNILTKKDIGYDSIVNLSKNNDGIVSSLQINIEQINLLKSSISSEISHIIGKKEFYNIYIPVGTIIGNEYTTGVGPKVKFRMQISANAIIDFSSKFDDAGINQVLHQVLIKIKIKGNLVMMGCTDSFSVSTSAIAAQTVIVGVTPGAFTNVVENPNNDLAGDINDYGAVN